MTKENPLISIITPTFNSKEYLEECIKSVMNQTYHNIEHIIVDGGSNDGTLDILKKYESKYNMRWISEHDNGMYDAISKGFSIANGDIYAWLNSDDMYMPWACSIVSRVMIKTDVKWCTGIPCHYDVDGICYNIPRITPVFPQRFIRKGYMDGRIATFLQQESMFWTKDLWGKCGYVLREYKMAGDYHLWKEFSKYTRLVVLDSILSGFRIHEGQKSADRKKYYEEIGELSSLGHILQRIKIVKAICAFSSLYTKSLRLRVKKYL